MPSGVFAVITNAGNVFGAPVEGDKLASVYQFSGAKIGFNPNDNFMVQIYESPAGTLAVITKAGNVFGADVVNNVGLEPVFQFSGAKIGFNPEDKFMVAMYRRDGRISLAVITKAGNVFGADVAARNIGPCISLVGQR